MTMHAHMTGNHAPQTGEWPQYLQELALTTARLHGSIEQGMVVPPYTTRMEGGDAVLRQDWSPTRHGEIRLYQSAEGYWNVGIVGQRPSFEFEGYGKTVRETQTYPLYPGAKRSLDVVMGSLMSDGRFVPEVSTLRNEEPTPDASYEALRSELADLLGRVTDRHPQPRVPRLPGWLRWLTPNR